METSESRPITVSWILRPDPAGTAGESTTCSGNSGIGGSLGLCFCPGKRHVRGGKKLERDLQTDLKRLKNHYLIECLVCLLNDAELRVRILAPLCHTMCIDLDQVLMEWRSLMNCTEAEMEWSGCVSWS